MGDAISGMFWGRKFYSLVMARFKRMEAKAFPFLGKRQKTFEGGDRTHNNQER